jgi:hypothetical protein
MGKYMASGGNELPYDFDLLWDIKTKAQLIVKYVQAQRDIKDIKEVCESHGMDIDKLVALMDDAAG